MSEFVASHILVVDDEPDLEELMRQRMRREVRKGAVTLSFAQNGREALDILRQNSDIEIVLSDINMPVMDGLTMLENIPSINDKLKTVMISAYGDMKNIRQAMNRGAFDFITKPVDFEDLRITINRTSERFRIERELHQNREKLISIQSELATAASMQQSILPRSFPSNDQYQIFGNMEPAREVGGDFFDVIRLPDNRVGLCIADVSGKGIPAAMFMMSARTWMSGASIGHPLPSKVLAEVNNLLEESNDSMMFVTLLYGVYDPATNLFSYANGGHNRPLLFKADGSVSEIDAVPGIALGVHPGCDFEDQSVRLSKGDLLLMYTDGVNEAERADEALFGMERLEQVFDGQPPPNDPTEVTQQVFSRVSEFVEGNVASDDITCLALCVKE
ncbi:MAG: SpoIIE family protein phosphatase [Gammaproteobacteria bacterium]|nr:SpoIIE family protein phosphatase [Gammaproteobacteria bacterium]MYF03425.1 SpoIIE family protein phosphatase [Gammaproteobacteria bacterium]MYI76619.1 SpoIIE family protein phosphatase [Gammaproteobacteria bacterium]